MAETLQAAHRVETLLNMAAVLEFPWRGKRDLLHFHGSLMALLRKSSLKKTWKRGPLKGYDCCQGDRRGEGEAQALLRLLSLHGWKEGGREEGRVGNPRQGISFHPTPDRLHPPLRQAADFSPAFCWAQVPACRLFLGKCLPSSSPWPFPKVAFCSSACI